MNIKEIFAQIERTFNAVIKSRNEIFYTINKNLIDESRAVTWINSQNTALEEEYKKIRETAVNSLLAYVNSLYDFDINQADFSNQNFKDAVFLVAHLNNESEVPYDVMHGIIKLVVDNRTNMEALKSVMLKYKISANSINEYLYNPYEIYSEIINKTNEFQNESAEFGLYALIPLYSKLAKKMNVNFNVIDDVGANSMAREVMGLPSSKIERIK